MESENRNYLGADYTSRQTAPQYCAAWFFRFALAGASAVESELRKIEQERCEGYRLPNPDDAVALTTFTVPTDPPALWADHVIQNHYERGLRFMFRWWDMENYHRCVRCGALDGICLRAGGFWSTETGNHSAAWYGETRCPCSDECNTRVPATEADDDAMVSMTAFVDGSAIRVVSTFRTGRRSMMRLGAKPDSADRDRTAQEINAMNHVLNQKPLVDQE